MLFLFIYIFRWKWYSTKKWWKQNFFEQIAQVIKDVSMHVFFPHCSMYAVRGKQTSRTFWKGDGLTFEYPLQYQKYCIILLNVVDDNWLWTRDINLMMLFLSHRLISIYSNATWWYKRLIKIFICRLKYLSNGWMSHVVFFGTIIRWIELDGIFW